MNQVCTHLFIDLLLYRACWNTSFMCNKTIRVIVHLFSRTQATSFIQSILWDVLKSSFTENHSKQPCVPTPLFPLPQLTFHLFCRTWHINIFIHVSHPILASVWQQPHHLLALCGQISQICRPAAPKAMLTSTFTKERGAVKHSGLQGSG